MTRSVEIFPDSESLAARAADLVGERVAEALQAHGVATVALSGGSTPRRTYELLADRGTLVPGRAELYFVDERCVPPHDRASNYRLVAETVGDAGNVHRMRGEDPPDAAAESYEALLRERIGPAPAFDLLILGVGPDGHTASLFPGSPELEVRDRWVVATRQPHAWVRRISLTLPVLNTARDALMLATGKDKARAVADVVGGGSSPAARVLGARLLIDEAAAGAAPPPPERPMPDELFDTLSEG